MPRRSLPPLASLIPLAALALLVVVFYRQAIFSNLIFARGDTLLYFYPYWDYRAQTLLSGQLPLWNPYLFMGVPFLANSQAGVFYPLNWPLIFFSAPVAVKISIVVHVLIAAWGAYALARRAFALDPRPAFLSATLFAFGGYLSAQVEHVNQLQGLAWLPWALLSTLSLKPSAYSRQPSAISRQPSVAGRPPSAVIIHCSLFSLFIALQLTAGHTQTAFITLAACGMIVAVQYAIQNTQFHLRQRLFTAYPQTCRGGSQTHPYRTRLRLYGQALSVGYWVLAIAFGFALAAIQLLPTLELSRLSLRGGGLPLNEAVSFSLHPLLLGRALLPGYSRLIFSEFVAYVGVVPLALAALGLAHWLAHHPSPAPPLARLQQALAAPLFPAILLAFVGLFFALGGYNPLYLLLANLPGFNFFRVPARWLVLFALGAALLAGYGLQTLASDTQRPPLTRRIILVLLSPLLLVLLVLLSANITPPGELGPLGLPAPLDLALWLTPPALSLLVLRSLPPQRRILGLLGLGIAEILLASLALPLNHLTAPEAYTSIRPAMTQLLAYQQPATGNQQPATSDQQPATSNQQPPARFLSLSALQFDPGDLAELHSAWDSQLAPAAVYDLIVATKHKEVLSPNLPLTWNVPAVDGYDGGILPLRAYAEFASQFGDVPPNTDGRLRQFLTAVPPNNLLSLTNTRWIITDKTGDAWLDNVFYDLGLTAIATAPTPLTLTRLPDFQATALGLVLGDPSGSGVAQIAFTSGETATLPITFDPARPAIRLQWGQPGTVKQIDLLTPNRLTLRGASLIDERTDTFHTLTLGPYRLAHSGDVKIYENLNLLPRAFIANTDPASAPFNASVVNRQASVVFLKYEAGHVVLQTSSDTPGYLILTDTHYPGWAATLDSRPVAIGTAYGLFRAVALPAGTHTVEFTFDPPSLKLGAAISALTIILWLLLLAFALRPTPNPQPSTQN